MVVGHRGVGRLALVAILCFGVVGCDFSSVVPPTPIAIRINLSPGTECPLVGFPDHLTFRIDPTAADQVVILDPDGRPYRVWWPTGFRGGTSDDPVVRDSRGLVVARDGEVLVVPQTGFPNLHGYSVCAGDGFYVQLQSMSRITGRVKPRA
jgi:hypothetical protein